MTNPAVPPRNEVITLLTAKIGPLLGTNWYEAARELMRRLVIKQIRMPHVTPSQAPRLEEAGY